MARGKNRFKRNNNGIFLLKESDTCFGKISGKPLKYYNSEIKAKEAAEYFRSIYGNEQVPYLCDVCGYWHLSPVDRQTRCRTCSCLDSNGNPKQLYFTYHDAKKRRNIIAQEKGINLAIYKCDSNEGYHLTHMHKDYNGDYEDYLNGENRYNGNTQNLGCLTTAMLILGFVGVIFSII